MDRAIGATDSTLQNWENEASVPGGQFTARLCLVFPDLADEFLRILASGDDFDAENPPVIAPTPEASAAQPLADGLLAASETPQRRSRSTARPPKQPADGSPPRA